MDQTMTGKTCPSHILKCVYQSEFPFMIDLKKNTIQWGDFTGSLKQFFTYLIRTQFIKVE